MKKKIFAGLFLVTFCLPNLAMSEGKTISKSQLKSCMNYYDRIVEKKGNVKELEAVIEEADDKIEFFESRMNEVKSQLSQTIGSKRTALISKYNSLNGSRSKFVYVYNMAIDKRKKRIGQHNDLLGKYKKQCVNVSVTNADLEEVCRGKGGFCDLFH